MDNRNRRDRALIKPIIAANVLVLCAAALGSCGSVPENVLNPPVTTVTIGPEPGESSEPTRGEVEKAAKKSPVWNDGMYQVGEDIKPGRYRTTNIDDNACYYARLSKDDGELSSIIANNLADGPMSVTISKSDAFVEFNGGCEWKKAPGGN